MDKSTDNPFIMDKKLSPNYPLNAALLAFAISQLINFLTFYHKEKRWDKKQLFKSGGVPSSTTATVSALAMAVGFNEGLHGPVFACALILAIIVVHNKTCEEERQAQENEILLELPPEHPLRASSTPREDYYQTGAHIAAGFVLGIMTAFVLSMIILSRAPPEYWESKIREGN
jgi:uncharacterized protein